MGEKPIVHRVSFQKTEDELQLYDEINNSRGLMGISLWYKIAAREKLNRDKQIKPTETQPQHFNQVINSIPSNMPVVNSLDELMKL